MGSVDVLGTDWATELARVMTAGNLETMGTYSEPIGCVDQRKMSQ